MRVSIVPVATTKRSTYPKNALLSNQLDEFVLNGALGVALTIGFKVAQVADMALVITRSAVGLGERID